MQGGLVLHCNCSVKYGAFFTIASPFSDRRNFFYDFFCTNVFFKMKLNNFLVKSFLIGMGLIIKFHLQSAFIEILESFHKTYTL